MKSIKYLIIPFVLPLTSFGPFQPGNSQAVEVNTSLIGTPNQNGIENVTIRLKNMLSVQKSFNILFAYYENTNSTNLIFASQLKPYNSHQEQTFLVKINHKYMPKNVINYLLIIRDQENKDVLKINQKLYHGTKFDEKITSSRTSFRSPTIAFEIKKNRKFYYKEDFQFNNLPDSFYQDQYLYLPLKSNFISYKGLNDLTYENVYLSFIDKNDIFKQCQTNQQKQVNIPLLLINYGQKYYISLLNDMYVHPNMLTMSFTKKEGYVKTRKFYFPHNKASVIESYTFTYNFIGLGLEKSNFTYDLKYIYDHNYIGECHNSDYCVISGVDNG